MFWRVSICSILLFFVEACSNSTAPPAAGTLVLHWTITYQGQTTTGSQPQALNLPNIGETATVAALEGPTQVAFTLSPESGCSNIVTVSPGTAAPSQSVTSVGTGQCTLDALTSDNQRTSLTVFSLPPP